MLSAMNRQLAIVVAAAADNGIGKNNSLPWRLKGDMAYFKRVTSTAKPGFRNAVIMGRKTWDSIPAKFKPLPERLNIVLSRTLKQDALPEGVLVADSLEKAVAKADKCDNIDQVFVIGGSAVYRQALESAACQTVHLTRVDGTFDCDTYLPKLDESVYELASSSEEQEEGGIKYRFCLYTRKKH